MSSERDDAVVRVEHLSKVYRVYSKPYHRLLQKMADRRASARRWCFEVPAVSDVSFRVDRGEALAIIGRNGSGKSTLLEMIAGTLEPTGGRVEHAGRVSALLELGTGFNPDFTGRQNFRINAAIHGLTEREIDAIEPAVEAFAEIGPFIDEPVRTYSSGMYVRLAFAAAVHVVPDLLIVDEALAVGDVFFQQKCFEHLTTVMAGVTKLIVTHDLATAVRLANRCIVMDRGRVVFDGEPLEAVETYTALHLRERGSTRVGSVAAARRSSSGVPVTPDDAATDGTATRFTEVDAARSSNPDAMRVLGVAVRRRSGDEVMELDGAALTVLAGDELQLRFDVEVGVPVREPVWGYLVRDRVGNALFGQNSVGSGIDLDALMPGRYVVDFELTWPEVEGGDYVLTVGLGQGLHPLHHSIVSWAQSVAKITCVPRRPVHGSFNNDLRTVRVTPHDRAAAPAEP